MFTRATPLCGDEDTIKDVKSVVMGEAPYQNDISIQTAGHLHDSIRVTEIAEVSYNEATGVRSCKSVVDHPNNAGGEIIPHEQLAYSIAKEPAPNGWPKVTFAEHLSYWPVGS